MATISSNNNDSGENNLDESVSTCTELSLCSSAAVKVIAHSLTRFGSPVQHQQNLMNCESVEKTMVAMGRSEIKTQGNISNKLEEKGPKCNNAENVGQHQKSDSNSEVVSAFESVGNNNRSNLYMCGENEKGKMAFIDFLDVGAT
ncbi:hypothetical protein CASFOL_019337 [Castilleja foliolosa]|uniref:Uncharacterized protein n=1 Tax=Castilleja foliolosa TaxID=1961234 RepID=A0ABD3D4R8_9LAMI